MKLKEGTFLVIAAILDSIMACGSVFVPMPLWLMLILAVVPCLLTIPFWGSAK